MGGANRVPRRTAVIVIVGALALLGIAVGLAIAVFDGARPTGDLSTSLSASASEEASASPSPTAEPTVEPSAEPTQRAAALEPGTVLRVMVDGLRMRASPSMEAELVDTLNAGETLGAVGGPPVEADGNLWYEVRQGPTERTGWVSSGDARDWLTAVRNGRIAFYCVACPDIAPDSTVGTVSVEPDGSDPLLVLDRIASPTWSPDGSRIALVVHGQGADEPPTLMLVGPDGSDPVDLGIGGQVAWSPDGTLLLFSGGTEPGLKLVDEGGNVTTMSAEGGDPAWSPDGLRIAVTAPDCPNCEAPVIDPPSGIFLLTPPEGALELLVGGGAYGPVWSPDGETISFSRLDYEGDFPWSFLQVPSGGGEPEPMPGVPEEAAINGFAWSPDGSLIAFGTPEGVLVANADGTDPHLVAANEGDLAARNPRWSPDGELILYDVVATLGDAIYPWIVGADGTDPHAVRAAGGYEADWQAILAPLP
jgi:hypothetical protein